VTTKINLGLLSDTGFVALSKIFNTHNIKLYCVGGAVRDALLQSNAPIDQTDIDLSIPAPPNKVVDILNRENISYRPTGIDFGTITVQFKGKDYEITSFRQDIRTDGRHPVVSYGASMLDDAQRRDFTFNALYYDSDGILYDPLNLGINDLQNHYSRFIGCPDQRIKEDYLRIFRYFRFLAYFNVNAYDAKIFKSKESYIDGLNRLSNHRIRAELLKLIKAPNAANILDVMDQLGFCALFFSDLTYDIHALRNHKRHAQNIEYLLPSLFFKTPKKILQNNTLLTNNHKKKTLQYQTLHTLLSKALLAHDWVKIGVLSYEYPLILWQNLLSIFAETMPPLKQKINTIQNLKFPDFTLTGKDLIAQGFQQGKEIAAQLNSEKKIHVQKFLQENMF